MSEKERTILENLGKVLPNLPESKKEYLIGLGDGIAMAREEKNPHSTTCAQSMGLNLFRMEM